MTIEFEGVDYGLIPEGFRPMPQPVCVRFITAKLVEIWSVDITENDIDFDSQFGQWIAVESEQMAEQFEIAEGIYNAFDPDFSSGDALDKNLRIVGVKRDPGGFTTVEVLLEGDADTIIEAEKIVSVPGGPKFRLPQQTTIEAGGTLAVFEAKERGAVKVFAGDISIIETPVLGWDSATNPEDGVVGREKETDSVVRVRRRRHVSAGGSGRIDPIREAVRNVPGVTDATVYENDTDVTNARGQPKRSVEVVALGGDNDAIAQALWDNKPGATPYVGTVSGDIVDSQGFPRNMKFSRVEQVAIWVTYEITVDGTFPPDGENTIKTNTVNRGDALEIGETVVVNPFLIGNLADVDGITNSVIKVGLAPNPTLSDNIPMSDIQKADFDTSRTVVVFV